MVALKRRPPWPIARETNRSRNAVVALKLAMIPACPLRSPQRSRNAVVALKVAQEKDQPGLCVRKQERRGGIETSRLGEMRMKLEVEAGTPWWH